MTSNIKEINNLLLKLRQGDNSALDSLYEITNKQLYVLCYSYFGNREDSEDALYDAYIKIVENRQKFQGKNGFNWIYTITKNICINKLKKQKRVVKYDFTNQNTINKLSDNYNCGLSADDESGIIELSKKVLNEIEFQIVLLHAVNDYKFKEIADTIGILESTARWKYNNAINKIKKEYERRFGNE